MTSRADVIVIGGGVIGCSIAWALARRGIAGVVVLEREADVGEGASKANSAIVHTGFDAKPGTVEAEMLRRSAELWPALVEELAVPFLQVGAVMVARSSAEATQLAEAIGPAAAGLGVPTEALSRADLATIAPYLTEDAVAGLLIPGESIVDPFWLTRAYAEAAMAGGATIARGARVTALRVGEAGVWVEVADGRTYEAAQAIDAAGLHADEIAGLAGAADFAITPRRGQFLVSEESFGLDRIVLPVPGPMGKGMLVTPIIFGGALLGPTAEDGTDKDDRGSRPDDSARILAAAASLVPAMGGAIPVRSFVGLRPVPSTGGYILGPSTRGDRLWLACGIRSTGISASPAIAEAVAEAVIAARGWTSRRRTVDARPPEIELPDEPGEIVCLCRGVSRGELEAACRRPLGPLTLDAVKRRGGAMFGDCQGNLCAVDVARLLAAEGGRDVLDVEKGLAGSWVFAGRTTPESAPAGDPGSPDDLATEARLVVVGLGRAGAAALARARLAGISAIGIDRRAGWTVVGLAPEADGWMVEAQAAHGSVTVHSGAVLIATGGFVQPREQREVAGPRSAGIITSDMVDAALAAGLTVGRRALVIGRGDLADALVARLGASGTEVAGRFDQVPSEVRGDARLREVRIDDAWVEADTLVLADRLLSQTFLLRPLGLVDGRPGTAAPAALDGSLAPAGLWAAGCCVTPDIDHADCAAAGERVADAIIDALRVRS